MKNEMGINIFISALLAGLIAFTSGCTPRAGWSVNFGIHPVNSIDDHHKLEREEYVKANKDRY